MTVTRINNISKYTGKQVKLNGWVYNSRRSGKIGFLMFRDGFGLLQCIVTKNNVGDEAFEIFKSLTQESSLSLQGEVVENDRAPGGYEIVVSSLELHQLSTDYPITPKEHGTDFLMNHRHLWLRSKRQHAILRVRHEIIKAIRDFFDSNDFTLCDSPIFTSNAAEGTSTLFGTEYFGNTAYLAQTGQLYGEAAAMAFGRHYNFGPTFRAEKSKTRRHLTEFWMVEPEIAYCDLDGNMTWAEHFVQHIVSHCLEHCRTELDILERDVSKLEKVKIPFPRITYDEAVKILEDKGVDFKYGSDFGGTDETLISDEFDCPVMIHRWPAEIKAFYMKRDGQNPDLALGLDMLAPEGYGEIIGGGQREDDHDILVSRIKEHGLPMDVFGWYLDLRKYGSVPHSGFGLGIERTVTWISGIRHIRQTIPFPRTLTRLEP